MATFQNRKIEDTYQFLLQNEGGTLQDGLGQTLTNLNLGGGHFHSASFSGSFTGSALFEDIRATGSLTGSFSGSADASGSFSGSFEGDGSKLTNITASVAAFLNQNVTYSQSLNNDSVVIQSAGNLYTNLLWSQSANEVNITRNNHGLSTGDFVVIKNMSTDNYYVAVTASSANTLTVTLPFTGSSQDTEGAYVPALTVTSTNGYDEDMTLAKPAVGDVKLQSLDLYIESSETSIKELTVPAVGSSLKDRTIPHIQAYNAAGAQISRINAASVLFDTTSTNYGLYKLNGGLDTFGRVIVTLKF